MEIITETDLEDQKSWFHKRDWFEHIRVALVSKNGSWGGGFAFVFIALSYQSNDSIILGNWTDGYSRLCIYLTLIALFHGISFCFQRFLFKLFSNEAMGQDELVLRVPPEHGHSSYRRDPEASHPETSKRSHSRESSGASNLSVKFTVSNDGSQSPRALLKTVRPTFYNPE